MKKLTINEAAKVVNICSSVLRTWAIKNRCGEAARTPNNEYMHKKLLERFSYDELTEMFDHDFDDIEFTYAYDMIHHDNSPKHYIVSKKNLRELRYVETLFTRDNKLMFIFKNNKDETVVIKEEELKQSKILIKQ